MTSAAEEETFEKADAGASLTYPVQAGSLKKGSYVCIQDHPCRVSDVSTSKTGKHGHAKANIVAIDIFTGKKYEDIAPTSHTLPCPVIKTAGYSLMDISHDGRLSLMDDAGLTREDLNLPEDKELADKIKETMATGVPINLIVVSAMGKECVLGFKEDKN